MEGEEPEIKHLRPKKLIGISVKMSLIDNQTGRLWGEFAPRIKEIKNLSSNDKFSLQVYDTEYFRNFNPNNTFEKWALVEVSDLDSVPEKMHIFNLDGGLYAVFNYKGSSADSYQFFQYIFQRWIPESEYALDNRPHFEVLGEKYINNDVNSEEEIWIPVKRK